MNSFLITKPLIVPVVEFVCTHFLQYFSRMLKALKRIKQPALHEGLVLNKVTELIAYSRRLKSKTILRSLVIL